MTSWARRTWSAIAASEPNSAWSRSSATETETTSTFTNIFGADGELSGIRASLTQVVTPNAVEVNLGSFTDPLLAVAGAGNHGTDWMGASDRQGLRRRRRRGRHPSR